MRVLFRFYQVLISPILGPGCRFHPTCSRYAMQAYEAHGFWKATRMTLSRIARCHPFHPGGYDPILKENS